MNSKNYIGRLFAGCTLGLGFLWGSAAPNQVEENDFTIFSWAVAVGSKGGLMVSGAVWSVTVAVWAVTTSVWTVEASMQDFTDAVWCCSLCVCYSGTTWAGSSYV